MNMHFLRVVETCAAIWHRIAFSLQRQKPKEMISSITNADQLRKMLAECESDIEKLAYSFRDGEELLFEKHIDMYGKLQAIDKRYSLKSTIEYWHDDENPQLEPLTDDAFYGSR